MKFSALKAFAICVFYFYNRVQIHLAKQTVKFLRYLDR